MGLLKDFLLYRVPKKTAGKQNKINVKRHLHDPKKNLNVLFKGL